MRYIGPSVSENLRCYKSLSLLNNFGFAEKGTENKNEANHQKVFVSLCVDCTDNSHDSVCPDPELLSNSHSERSVGERRDRGSDAAQKHVGRSQRSLEELCKVSVCSARYVVRYLASCKISRVALYHSYGNQISQNGRRDRVARTLGVPGRVLCCSRDTLFLHESSQSMYVDDM